MRTVVFTSDKHSWLLRGFLHQWEKYVLKLDYDADYTYETDPMNLEVAGFTRPNWWPECVPFYSIGKFADYPVNKWSDAVIKYLEHTSDDFVLILLEDYWMIRPVNRHAVFTALGFMEEHRRTIRFDLTSDRMYSGSSEYAGYWGGLDICKAKGQYSLSFQAAIYNRAELLSVMVHGETPWQAEMNGTTRLNMVDYDVVGSYQWPMNYAIVVNKGELDRSGNWMKPARTLYRSDWLALDKLGYTEKDL